MRRYVYLLMGMIGAQAVVPYYTHCCEINVYFSAVFLTDVSLRGSKHGAIMFLK